MTKRIRKRPAQRDTITLAGWLFADLLLGLASLFLIASPPPPSPPTPTLIPIPTTPVPTSTLLSTYTAVPTQTPLPTHTPFSTQTPLPTYTPRPTYTLFPTLKPLPTGTIGRPGIENVSRCYNIQVDREKLLEGSSTSRAEEEASIRSQLSNFIIYSPDFRPGTVLIWGHGINTDDGVAIAREVKQSLLTNFGPYFEDVGIKSLFFSSGLVGQVQIEIYFFTDSEYTISNQADCAIES